MGLFGLAIFAIVIISVISASAKAKANRPPQKKIESAFDVEDAAPAAPPVKRAVIQPQMRTTPLQTTIIDRSDSRMAADFATKRPNPVPNVPKPETRAVAQKDAPSGINPFIDLNEAARAVVLSEVLGKPKALQRRHGA